ncbi:MAG: aryl-alcohol dehydrogenase-like predicted oxidoreductase [Alteromonadaceae bacterium]|jgi:aryl-alcohol dehydrogenase-like predicted oxidoreductase
MKLALGTVQFGLDYSISNTSGQVDPAEVKKILDYALSVGINTLDTAQAYGNAEQVLGGQATSGQFALISKVSGANSQADTIMPSIDQSLKTLNCEKLDSLLMHDAASLLQADGEAIFAQLEQAKQQGKVSKIGVSVYQPQELTELCQRFAIDRVQLPLNLFDQRFLAADVTDLLTSQQVEAHCRSAFLQGIIFCEPASLPAFFNPLKSRLQLLTDTAKMLSVSPMALCLTMLKRQPFISKIVVGCCSVQQLQQVVEAYHQADEINPQVDFSAFAVTNTSVINPVNWPAK